MGIFKPRAKPDYDAIQWPIGRSGVSESAIPHVTPTEQGIISPDDDRTDIWEHPVGRLSESVDATWSDWRVTTREAAETLIRIFGGNEYVMTGNGPMRITEQWGSVRAGYIEPARLIGDSSSGIEPCGYEEL
jgi:hypothetical protein